MSSYFLIENFKINIFNKNIEVNILNNRLISF